VDVVNIGRELLLNQPDVVASLEVYAEGIENSKRPVKLLKVHKAYSWFRQVIVLYGAQNILKYVNQQGTASFNSLYEVIKTSKRGPWENVGGQLIEKGTLEEIKNKIRKGAINSWEELHDNYQIIGQQYSFDKLQHAIASMAYVKGVEVQDFTADNLKDCLEVSLRAKDMITRGIFESRRKDYVNPFRKMIYESEAEMDIVVGKLSDNSFIKQTEKELAEYNQQVQQLIESWKLDGQALPTK